MISQGLFFAHELVDAPPLAAANVQLALVRGKTIRGEIVGTGGATPQLVEMRYPCPAERGGFSDNYRVGWTIRHGHFAVHGLPANGETRVAFFDPVAKEGKYVIVHGTDAQTPLKIRLEQCGSATLKYVDEERKPLADLPISVWAHFAEETDPIAEIQPPQRWSLTAHILLNTYDAADRSSFTTGADGKLELPALIPGFTYGVGTGNRGANNVLEYRRHPRQARPTCRCAGCCCPQAALPEFGPAACSQAQRETVPNSK